MLLERNFSHHFKKDRNYLEIEKQFLRLLAKISTVMEKEQIIRNLGGQNKFNQLMIILDYLKTETPSHAQINIEKF